MSWGSGNWFGDSGGGGSDPVGPFSAGDIIQQARARHPAFSEQAIPIPVALSHVSTVQANLHQAAQQMDPFYVVGTYVHLLATFEADIPLPAHAGVSGGRVLLSPSGTGELFVATRTARLRSPSRWNAVLINQQLTLVGDADYWTNVSEVDVYYAPVATALSALTNDLVLPASAWSAVIAALALAMAGRCEALGISGVDVNEFKALADEARTIWLNTVRGMGKAVPLRVRGRVVA